MNDWKQASFPILPDCQYVCRSESKSCDSCSSECSEQLCVLCKVLEQVALGENGHQLAICIFHRHTMLPRAQQRECTVQRTVQRHAAQLFAVRTKLEQCTLQKIF